MNTVLPSKFIGDRIYLCPTTSNGMQIIFWIDTGGPTFIKSEKARQLGLIPFRQMFSEGELDVVPYPEFKEGLSIPHGSRVKCLFVRDDLHPEIDGMLGMPYFADRVWIFDYLNHQVIHVVEQGEQRPCDGHVCDLGFATDANGVRQISFPRIQAEIDGEEIDFLFDTGATLTLADEAMEVLNDGLPQQRATSFIVGSVFDAWRARYPDWIVVDKADVGLNREESIIRVPSVCIGGYTVGPVWFTRRADRNFENFSRWMDQPIRGALGGNVFKFFSMLIDYPRAFAHLSSNGTV